MSSNIISCASIFPLIYSFVFLSNLEILVDRLSATISVALLVVEKMTKIAQNIPDTNVNKIFRVASKHKQANGSKQAYMQSAAIEQGNQNTTRERWKGQIINDESCSIPDCE
jgi:hypothetical protein